MSPLIVKRAQAWPISGCGPVPNVQLDVWTRGAGVPVRFALDADDARDLAEQLLDAVNAS